MRQPKEGEFFDGPALVLPDRQLRVTRRCLEDDLGGDPDGDLEDHASHPIVRAFFRERRTKLVGGRDVAPLTSGKSVYVVAHEHSHRGGTWHDEHENVIWLVAYRRHQSGDPSDFFPWCKKLDADDRLLPDADDYRTLLQARDGIFAARLTIQAPLLLKKARDEKREVRSRLGGVLGASVAVEIVGDVEGITVAFDWETFPQVWTYIPAILGALIPGSSIDEWDEVEAMPSRDLSPSEFAFEYLGEIE